MATNVYIDGFNLYYGSLKRSDYKWLDLEALCARLFPSDHINRIRYFTARVSARPDDLEKPQRQQTYLRALGTLPKVTIHYGHYLSTVARMPLADPPARGARTVKVIRTEEKGSDVNLATHLLLDAFRRDCDVAIVISNDGDLKEPIRVARTELGIKVGVANPHPPDRRSRALECDFFKQIRASALRQCQFADVVEDEQGSIRRPTDW